MNPISQFAPAKINLFLAITGRRADGFHDLLSVAAPLTWGDMLHVQTADTDSDLLECDQPGIPLDDTNLVLRAARLFRQATGWAPPVRFRLQKQIPAGAGLGGGSSDGTAALLCLNRLAGHPLSLGELAALAAKLGSDCALFLENAPCVMRGRGELIQPLPSQAAARLRGRRLLVFKPNFGISTPWAYGQMVKAAPSSYLPAEEAERRLEAWIGTPQAPAEELLFNNMEAVAFEKYVALPTLLNQLRETFGLAVGMSGSGSACFALLDEKVAPGAVRERIQAAWGTAAFVVETRIG